MPREGSLGPDAREQVEHEKVSPLSEKGANCDESYDQQNDEVNKQLLKFMTDLEVDVTNKSIGKDQQSDLQSNSTNQLFKVQLEQQNNLLKMHLMHQKQLAKASKVQLLKSFNKQYPQGKNIKPGSFMNIESEVQKIANRINSQMVMNQQVNLSPSEKEDSHSIMSKGIDNHQLQQISLINLNKNHISTKKAEDQNESHNSQEKRDTEKKSKSLEKVKSNSIEAARGASNSMDCNLSDSIVINKSFSESDDIKMAKPKQQSPGTKQTGPHQNQKKRSSQKREKIFIGIYSSYLSLNKSYSRERGVKQDDNQKKDHQKQTQNLHMVENKQVEDESVSENELEGSKDQTSQKQGLSSIIKYIDLSKFKIEKCKNQAQGRQHNIKHCRYFHTLKDRRRLLDFDFINLGIDEIIQLAKTQKGHQNKTEADIDQITLKQNPDEYFKFSMKSLHSLMDQIYLPDLCTHQNTDKCPTQDYCQMSHNRVESVYHPEKYKSKYCTKYPKNLQKCEYGDYCSFAHSTKELKTRLIHKMTKDADFYMFYFKTEWCPFNKEHNKAQCVYAHNWQDFRRKPNIFQYKAHTICENWKPGTFIAKYHEGCPEQASCPNSHGWKEQEYHPMFYKTMKCEEFKNTSGSSKHCQRGIECPYFHSEEEKREPVDINQRRDRKDFYYDKILEMSMNLSNINQLQELILIKISEQYCNDQQKRQYYLENRITRQYTQGLINNNSFRNITLFCMLSKKVLPFDQFTNHVIVRSLNRDKTHTQHLQLKNNHPKTKFSSKSVSSSNPDIIDSYSRQSNSSNSESQTSKQKHSHTKIPNRNSNPNFEQQKQINLHLYSSQGSSNSDQLVYQQFANSNQHSQSPAFKKDLYLSQTSGGYFGNQINYPKQSAKDFSEQKTGRKQNRDNSRSSFHSKHSINSETPSNYGRLDQPGFPMAQQQTYNYLNQPQLTVNQQQLFSHSHSPPNNVCQVNQMVPVQSHQGNHHVNYPAGQQNSQLQTNYQSPLVAMQHIVQPNNQTNNSQNWAVMNKPSERGPLNQASGRQELTEHDKMPTDNNSCSNNGNKQDPHSFNQNANQIRGSNTYQMPDQHNYNIQMESPNILVESYNCNKSNLNDKIDQPNKNWSPLQPIEKNFKDNMSPEQSQNLVQQPTGSLFRQYFNSKFQGDGQEAQDDDDRMSIQPANQKNQINMEDDQFRFKKFNSQRFDPKQINIKTLEFQLNSLVEELTQDADANQDSNILKPQLGAQSEHEGQLSIFSGFAQNQLFDNKASEQQQQESHFKQLQVNASNNTIQSNQLKGTVYHQNNQNQVGHQGSFKVDQAQIQSQIIDNQDKTKIDFGYKINQASNQNQNQFIVNRQPIPQVTNNDDDPFFYDENIIDQKTHKNFQYNNK